MGYYLQTPMSIGKADYLITTHGATRLPAAPSWDEIPDGKSVICVVDNALFEAAGYAYSARELSYFADPRDTRNKEWLLLDTDTVHKLSNYRV